MHERISSATCTLLPTPARYRHVRVAITHTRAAGASWTRATGNAPWAARKSHSSVIDAAGRIYVLGGGSIDGGTDPRYNDVWRSDDQGAAPHRCVARMQARVCVRVCVWSACT